MHEEITRVNLDDVDYAALARAYKILYFNSIRRSKIVELFFKYDDDEIESYEDGASEREISPEVAEKVQRWLADNMERLEVTIAMRMVFGEMTKGADKEFLADKNLTQETA